MDQVYSFLAALEPKFKSKQTQGVMTAEKFEKKASVMRRYFSKKDMDVTMLDKFVAFIVEKYSITNCLLCYEHLMFMLDEYVKMEDITVPVRTMSGGLFLNEETGIVFKEKDDSYVAVGHLDEDDVDPLNLTDISVCEGNQWKWDFNSATPSAKHIKVSPYVTKL